MSFVTLRHFQGAKHFTMNQRLRLDTLGWRVLDFNYNPLPNDEIERERARIMRTPFLQPDREHPFFTDLITDDAGVVDQQLPILAEVSSLLEVLQLKRKSFWFVVGLLVHWRRWAVFKFAMSSGSMAKNF